jgi:hypothetical protein
MDSGGTLMGTLLTASTDCAYNKDKEFMGMWITYRNKTGTINRLANACDVYFNVDDLMTSSGGTNFLTALSWTKIGQTKTICTDGSGALTTQVYDFAVLSGLTKGRRIGLLLSNTTDVEIDALGIIWRPLFTGPLGLDRGVDRRAAGAEYVEPT